MRENALLKLGRVLSTYLVQGEGEAEAEGEVDGVQDYWVPSLQ